MIQKADNIVLLLIGAVFVLSLGSCNPGKGLEKEENEKIENYLKNNPDLNYTKTSSGLYYLEISPGTGAIPVAGDSAFVRYVGKFLNGTEFDSNITATEPYDFIVGDNITGFDEGISMMMEGGKSKLLIPSKLAYGATGSYPFIPGYSPLLFEIELIRVIPAEAK
jgi:FKBP-type peptidyl-prolyl cis-trans isomerase FkpA